MGFKFVNSYFVLYYVAFFKKQSALFGVQMNCYQNDCMLDLQSQLAVFVFFRIIVHNLLEFSVPRFKVAYRQWRLKGNNCVAYMQGHNILELADMAPAERESKQEVYSSFADFDESLITHGYATLFAVTSPWVCAATLLGTLLEVWTDSTKIAEMKQRPMPICCRNNEPWSTAFHIYGCLAAFTNMFLLIFASSQYESWSLTEKLTLFVFLEHLVFLAHLFIKALFPETPRSVELLQLKQDHVVHRCLENIKVEPSQDFSMFRDSLKADQIEVFEGDYLEDDDLEEPQLSLRDSSMTMYNGLKEVVPDVVPAAARQSMGMP